MKEDKERHSGMAGWLAASFSSSKLSLLGLVGSLMLGMLALALLPREEEPQIKVPMIWWQSSQVYADQACMQTHASRAPVSHDHLFHTLLGMFDVKTAAYTPELDLLATCRKGQPQ